MTLHEAQEHLSRYLAEARVRPLSNEEVRHMEDVKIAYELLALADDDCADVLIQEFRRTA